jgi:hypothetical protein
VKAGTWRVVSANTGGGLGPGAPPLRRGRQGSVRVQEYVSSPPTTDEQGRDPFEGRVDGLYLVLISLHGLVRGERMELGRDPDTGGQARLPTLQCVI